MRLLYKPFSVLARGIASKAGKAMFRGLWSRIDDRDPPEPKRKEASLAKILTATTLEAATMAAATAVADRASARAFEYLFGVWPGEKAED